MLGWGVKEALNRIWVFLINEKIFTFLLILYFIVTLLTKGSTLALNRFVNFKSIAVIASFIFISRALDASGIFPNIAVRLTSLSRSSLRIFTFLLLTIVALSAALIMNDASLFIYVPLIMSACRIYNLPIPVMATLITLAANIGSALTPIGNPQNIIVWQHYGVQFHEFLISLMPFFTAAFLILIPYSLVLVRGQGLRLSGRPPPLKVSKLLLTASLTLLPLDVMLSEMGMQYLSLVLTASVLFAISREVIVGADYVLISIFILMFADFRGLASILQGLSIYPLISGRATIILYSALLSQAISNVPAAILLVNGVRDWMALAVGVNLGGVGFITGSLANLITLRLTHISLKDYHKYALPYFASLLVATLLIYRF